MNFEILETERLYLRKLTDELYEEILLNGSDGQIYMYLNIDGESVAKEKEKAKKGFGMFNKSLLIFQLIDKETQQIIGWCGYHTWFREHRRAELGYALNREEAKRRGFMAEALEAVIGYGFKVMNLHRVEALVAPDNIPSLKLVQKFGFIKEGYLREHYFKNGVFEDSVFFALLAAEYAGCGYNTAEV